MQSQNIHYTKAIPALLIALCFLPSLSVQAASDPRQPKKFTQIDVPGASFTQALAINPRGDIVGLYFDSSGNGHGFLLSKGAFTTIDLPGAVLTDANGINPRGDIVGDYIDSSGNGHGFLLSK